MADKGATTIWELWNGDTADPGMNSHNHLMLTGDLGIWIYEYLAGIKSDPKQPGFKHIIMRPHPARQPSGHGPAGPGGVAVASPVGDLKFVNATHRSLFGEIGSNWRVEDGLFVWDVAIPPNATAMVCVPAKDLDAITESGKSVAEAAGVQFLRMESGYAVFAVESGSYHFRAPR
jgi:alpha-L-rhamnosidase